MITQTSIFRAWTWLLLLSLGATFAALLHFAGLGRIAISGLVLSFSWIKARIILAQYLGLVNAPFWRRGFDMCLALFCLLIFGLYVSAGN